MRVVDLTGLRFERLVVLERAENDKYGRARWKVVCDCGQSKIACARELVSGDTKSCGCLRKETTATTGRKQAGNKYVLKHGHAINATGKSRNYHSWQNMKSRCYNPNTPKYSSYGALGVTVCDRWKDSFENFIEDLGSRPLGTTLGRKGDTGNYEPGNCAWQTSAEQVANRRPDRIYRNKYTSKKEAAETIAA